MLSFTTTVLPDAICGREYVGGVVTSGGVGVMTITAKSGLPGGLSILPSGQIVGTTNRHAKPRVAQMTFEAVDAGGPPANTVARASVTLPLNIVGPTRP
jgi:hypothetical protein